MSELNRDGQSLGRRDRLDDRLMSAVQTQFLLQSRRDKLEKGIATSTGEIKESAAEKVGKTAIVMPPEVRQVGTADISDEEYDALNLQEPMDGSGYIAQAPEEPRGLDPLQQLARDVNLAGSNERSPEAAQGIEDIGLGRQSITGIQKRSQDSTEIYSRVPPG
jgi:hypothetical protein